MSMGISIKFIFALTWSLAAVTAGLAGLLIADLTVGVSGDNSSQLPSVPSPVIILGGLDSILGAIIGGILIGLIESYASGYIDASLKNVVPLSCPTRRPHAPSLRLIRSRNHRARLMRQYKSANITFDHKLNCHRRYNSIKSLCVLRVLCGSNIFRD